MLYLLIGASGSGKTSLGRFLHELEIPELISTTTRKPREGESQGNPYYFVDITTFNNTPMVETTNYAGNFYGASKAEVDRLLSLSGNSFAIVDKHGVEAFKALYPEWVKVIFVYAHPEDVFNRMLARGDKPKDVYERVSHAEKTGEFNNFDIADYCIINKDLYTASKQLMSIIN